MSVTKVSAGDSAVFFESSVEDRQALAETVAASSTRSADEVTGLVEDLAEHEKALLDWMGRAPENAELFLEDPLAALEKAGLGIGAETVARLRSVAEDLAGSTSVADPTPPPGDRRPSPAAAAGTPTLKLQGWDLVAANTQKALNNAFALLFAAGLIPKTFTERIGATEVTVNVGAPSIDLDPTTAGGRKGVVGITSQIESGSIKGPVDAPIPSGKLEVVTVLSFVQFPGQEEATIERLALDFTSGETVCNVTIDQAGWDPAWTKLLEEGILGFLRRQPPGAFFVGEVEVPKAEAPIAPAGKSDFAVQAGPEPAENVLLLLMLTPSGKAGNPDFGSAPSLVPAGQSAAVYISNRLLIDKVAVPSLAEGLKVSESSFSLSGSSTELSSATFSGKKDLGDEYESELTGLRLEVDGNGQIQGAYTVAAHPGFNLGETYYFKVTGNVYVTPELDLSSQSLTFKTTANEGSAKIECSAAGWVIISFIVALTFGTVGALIAIVLAVVVPVVITQLRIPVNLPPGLLKELETGIDSFRWPAQKDFSLSAVELPGDLALIGEPTN